MKALASKRYADVIYLDFANAFHKVNHGILEENYLYHLTVFLMFPIFLT